MDDPIETVLLEARGKLEVLMSSENACAEYLAAMGHVDATLRALRVRDERLEHEAERQRIEDEAQANGTYDTVPDEPTHEGYTPD